MEIEALQAILEDDFKICEQKQHSNNKDYNDSKPWYQIEIRPFEDEEDEDELPIEST